MQFGVFFSVLFGSLIGNVWVGILLGGLMCMLLSFIWGWVVIVLGADQIISALGFIPLTQGGTVFLMSALLGQSGGIFSPVQLDMINPALLASILCSGRYSAITRR